LHLVEFSGSVLLMLEQVVYSRVGFE